MTNFIQKMRLDIGFSDFNCLLDSQCSLLTSQILGRCIKLKWSNRAYAVYWLCGTLLCPCLQTLLFTAFLATVLKILTYALVRT